MDTYFDGPSTAENDPLDAVEDVMSREKFVYERTTDDELHFIAPGAWADHQFWFAWSDGLETLHLCLSLDAKVSDERRGDVRQLLTHLNERLLLGHFDMWSDEDAIVYRSALPLADCRAPSGGQIAAMIASAREAGERFYPAFQLLMWGEKDPQEAVTAAMFETMGEA